MLMLEKVGIQGSIEYALFFSILSLSSLTPPPNNPKTSRLF